VREESHLDDMRSAIRGDFERLAERRGGQELMREPGEETEPVEPEPEPGHGPEPEAAEPEPRPEPGAERLLEEPSDELPTAADDASPEMPPRRSLLDRLLGR
jgi:hypothetical protein